MERRLLSPEEIAEQAEIKALEASLKLARKQRRERAIVRQALALMALREMGIQKMSRISQRLLFLGYSPEDILDEVL